MTRVNVRRAAERQGPSVHSIHDPSRGACHAQRLQSRSSPQLARPGGHEQERRIDSVASGVGLAGTPMSQNGFHHLPVLEGKIRRGILSQTGLYKSIPSYFFVESGREQREFMDEHLNLEAVMTPDPITVGPEQTVAQALELMIEHRISSVPLVNRQNELPGIMTSFDLLWILERNPGWSGIPPHGTNDPILWYCLQATGEETWSPWT